MERRFAARMQQALDDAVVDPAVFQDLQPRLERFVEPFAACLREPEQKEHARNYVTGLVSNLERKNVESTPTCTTRSACRCKSSIRPRLYTSVGR